VAEMARVGALMRREQSPELGKSSRVERAESRGCKQQKRVKTCDARAVRARAPPRAGRLFSCACVRPEHADRRYTTTDSRASAEIFDMVEMRTRMRGGERVVALHEPGPYIGQVLRTRSARVE
jgi:Mg-chelatase subunit ChlD